MFVTFVLPLDQQIYMDNPFKIAYIVLFYLKTVFSC